MTPLTLPRPVLSERQRDMLTSLGLAYRTTDLAVIVDHPFGCITRLDTASVDLWLSAYAMGRGITTGSHDPPALGAAP
jgi:hypothetical protein